MATSASRIQENHVNTEKSENGGVYDVIIIGAGWAGLAAANILKKNGMTNFIVLEGRDYIGGRSRTVYDFGEDIPIDLGSEWVQGTINNPIFDIADKHKIPGANVKDSIQVYRPNGEKFDTKSIFQTMPKLYKRFLEYQENRQSKDKNDTNLQQVMDDFKKKLPDNASKELFDVVVEFHISGDYGCNPSDMSLFCWDDDLDYEGDDLYMGVRNGGFTKIIDTFAEKILSNIQLDSKVTEVDYSSNLVKVIHEEKNNTSVTKIAKKVLVTLPVGVLRKGTVKFTPSFPNIKKRAIDHIGPGEAVKVFLYWENMSKDEVFWPKDVQFLEFAACKPSMQGRFTLWMNAYNVNGNIPTLRCFLTGSHALYADKKADTEVVAEAVEALRANYGHANVPDPSHSIVTKWLQDEFSMGTYSYVQVNVSESARKDLFMPIHNRLYFAGEATSSSYPGSTHGALQSGVDAANNMMENKS